MKISHLIGAFLFLTTTSLIAAQRCGTPAPGFTLPSANGESVSLNDFRGKIVVLEWFNHNCPFVNKFYSVGAMQDWQREMTQRGVIWLVIDSTNPGHRDHIKPGEAASVYNDMHMAATALLLDQSGQVGHCTSHKHAASLRDRRKGHPDLSGRGRRHTHK